MSAQPQTVGGEGGIGRLVMALLTPLAVVVLAYGLWRISDALLYIGPLDRAAFGWAVVIPVWLLAPVAAGFAWRRLRSRERNVVALTLGVLIAGAAGTLFWLATAFPNCQYGANFTPADVIGPALLLGGVMGGSLVVASLVATSFIRDGHPWWGLVIGAGSNAVLQFLGFMVTFFVMISVAGVFHACQRPPIP